MIFFRLLLKLARVRVVCILTGLNFVFKLYKVPSPVPTQVPTAVCRPGQYLDTDYDICASAVLRSMLIFHSLLGPSNVSCAKVGPTRPKLLLLLVMFALWESYQVKIALGALRARQVNIPTTRRVVWTAKVDHMHLKLWLNHASYVVWVHIPTSIKERLLALLATLGHSQALNQSTVHYALRGALAGLGHRSVRRAARVSLR